MLRETQLEYTEANGGVSIANLTVWTFSVLDICFVMPLSG